jgi:hypothetical protein
VGLPTVLAGCVLVGAFAVVVASSRARREEPPGPVEDRPKVYGPGTYAGPGSLGGTESAMPR